MKHTWRWFGPKDPVSLSDIRQSGATGIVTALHDVKTGDVWSLDDIETHHNIIKQNNLVWSVVESVPIHEDIKRRQGNFAQYIENFKQTLRNLAANNIKLICYNFMPILDWTRTNLAYELDNGAKALKFDATAFAAFDLYILKRENAIDDYTENQQQDAQQYVNCLSDTDKKQLINTIIAGLQGSTDGYSLDEFRQMLASYQDIDKEVLRHNFRLFLEEIIPVAEQLGILMSVHPDDPPRPILGLPRIISNKADIEWLFSTNNSPSNGLTFCTGSFGADLNNNLPDMLQTFANKVYFAHLRSTKTLEDGSFYEDDHLAGDADLVNIIRLLLEEEVRRSKSDNCHQVDIPIRPDHGHQILDDLTKIVQPGYSAIGRLKGLAEIRGVETAIKRFVLH